MKRHKSLPLTETVYYILLSLLEPAHGYLILQKVEELSDGDVRMAAGTLYGAIENLLKLNYIHQVDRSDKRRKVYEITDLGRDILNLDLKRMRHMVSITEKQLNDKE
ncbi:MAG: PadR family transcriptional regulator [Bacillaceae bacterium]|nr:PadR family transcriptional regulator [Bacillaceae bacterium]